MNKRYRARREFKLKHPRNRHMEYHEEALDIIDSYLEKYQKDFDIDEREEWVKQNLIRIWLRRKDIWEKMGGTVSHHLEDYHIKWILGLTDRRDDYRKVLNDILRPKPGINLVKHHDFYVHKEPCEMQ